MNVSETTVARLAMLSLKGVGQKTVLRTFLDAHLACASGDSLIKEALRRSVGDTERTEAFDDAWRVINTSFELGIRIVSYDDPDYPNPLRAIPDPPPFLFVRGSLPDWDLAVAVIGTREPDQITLDATDRTVEALSLDRRVVIVSGLAIGVDTRAHQAALRHGLQTVAVLANGLDTVYPKANSGLAEEIVAAGGALISEMPVGTRATAFNLVARDRLQSGLSRATFLMQSSLDGGSMHTARFTLDQKRTLVALRPQVDTESWSGNRLLTNLVNWQLVPDSVRRFAAFSQPNTSLALRLSFERIAEFVEKGLPSRFVPGAEESAATDPEQQPLKLL